MTKLPESLGFREGTSSVHTSRTMMLGELSLVLEHVAPKAKVEEYMVAIAEGQRRLTRGEFRQFLGQAGDTRKENDTQSIDQLTQELAYEYWHRMLFARFLAENHLLMHPDGVAVSLEECEELARDVDPPAPNGFVLAARYASTMLPQIFRSDDVLLEIDFSPEHRLVLEKLLTSLPQVTFLADDSLGWVYQFWQSKRKKEVNESGNKIGANELPSVTQMFTEDYMVDFLLDNTLGAWHAGKVLARKPTLAKTALSEEELRNAMALSGCPWRYLRFIRQPTALAAGSSDTLAQGNASFCGWPRKGSTKRQRSRRSFVTTCSDWKLIRAVHKSLRSTWRWLQVAVARLLGYQWPAELSVSGTALAAGGVEHHHREEPAASALPLTSAPMRLSQRARDLVRRCEELLPFADRDGIVCLPAVRTESPAAERLLEVLHASYRHRDEPGGVRIRSGPTRCCTSC